jgi:DNA polymerase III subunit beta
VRLRSDKDPLAEALSLCVRVTGTRSTQPVLGGARLRASLDPSSVTVSATDLDLAVSRSVAADVQEPGDVVIQARLAHDVVRSLPPGSVDLILERPGSLEIRGERGRFELRTLPVEDFPRGPVLEGSAMEMEGSSSVLGEAFGEVARAASTDEARPILTGVLVAGEQDGVRLVATDSYRLALRRLPGFAMVGPDQRALIPARALTELGRLTGDAPSVHMALGDREARFEVGPTRLTTRLIEGEFIRYEQLVPEHYPHRLIAEKGGLIDGIRRVGLLAQNQIPVRVHLSPEGVALSAENHEVGDAREEMGPEVKYDGEEMTVAFNQRYIIDGLESTPGSTVSIEVVDPGKPAVIRPAEEGAPDFLYLLMPVRL